MVIEVKNKELKKNKEYTVKEYFTNSGDFAQQGILFLFLNSLLKPIT
jgi:hypothetical protein